MSDTVLIAGALLGIVADVIRRSAGKTQSTLRLQAPHMARGGERSHMTARLPTFVTGT